MYESRTIEVLHQELLSGIDDSYDKVPGSFVSDITKANAIAHHKLYQDLNNTTKKMSIENLQGNELEQYVYERTGLTRRLATYSSVNLKIVGNGNIKIGNLFETEIGIQFEAIENVLIDDEGIITVRCTIAGEKGNIPANQIKKMPVTIPGITSCNNTESATGGYEAESDEDLRKRYYERIQTPATSGNKAHYRNWAKEVSGIGDAKVFPLWNGDNTVEIVVVDYNKEPCDIELINKVQNYIDPNQSGKEEGVAPIGAYCTVESATGLVLNISSSIILRGTYELEEIKVLLQNNIREYLREIAFKEDYVSYAKIGAIILNTDGVYDYTNLIINSQTSNIPIENKQVPVLGGVSIV